MASRPPFASGRPLEKLHPAPPEPLDWIHLAQLDPLRSRGRSPANKVGPLSHLGLGLFSSVGAANDPRRAPMERVRRGPGWQQVASPRPPPDGPRGPRRWQMRRGLKHGRLVSTMDANWTASVRASLGGAQLNINPLGPAEGGQTNSLAARLTTAQPTRHCNENRMDPSGAIITAVSRAPRRPPGGGLESGLQN